MALWRAQQPPQPAALRLLLLLLLASCMGLRGASGLAMEIEWVRDGVAHAQSLCLDYVTFSAIITAASAGGSPPVQLAGRTVFAPTDAAFAALLHQASMTRAELLAMPAASLAAIVNEHVAYAAGAAVTTHQVDTASRHSVTLRMASGSVLLFSRGSARDDGTWQYLVNPGPFSSNASVVDPNVDCIVTESRLHTAMVVHGIDTVLMSPAATALALPGPLETARVDVFAPGGLPVTLVYPLTASALPPIVFAHGMRAPVAAYAATLARLASHGFVIAAVRSGLDIACDASPPASCTYSSLSAYIDSVVAVARWMISSSYNSTLSSAELAGRVDPSAGIGLLGHSMGGAAVLQAALRLAAAAPGRPGLRVAAVLALAPPNKDLCGYSGYSGPSGVSCTPGDAGAAADAATSVSVLVGSRDAIVPSVTGGEAIWAALHRQAGSGFSLLSVLERGTHCFTELPTNALHSQCGMLNVPATEPPPGERCTDVPGFSEGRCLLARSVPSGPALPRFNLAQANQLQAMRRHAVLFFRARLAGDAQADAILSGGAAQPLFTDAWMRTVALKE
jgi:hypothetical protein